MHTLMSRKALLATLAGAMALGLGAFSAQAAPVSMSGVRSGAAELVQKAHLRRDYWWFWRHHRHHRNHRWR